MKTCVSTDDSGYSNRPTGFRSQTKLRKYGKNDLTLLPYMALDYNKEKGGRRRRKQKTKNKIGELLR